VCWADTYNELLSGLHSGHCVLCEVLSAVLYSNYSASNVLKFQYGIFAVVQVCTAYIGSSLPVSVQHIGHVFRRQAVPEECAVGDLGLPPRRKRDLRSSLPAWLL